jgi:hypothetical protein
MHENSNIKKLNFTICTRNDGVGHTQQIPVPYVNYLLQQNLYFQIMLILFWKGDRI